MSGDDTGPLVGSLDEVRFRRAEAQEIVTQPPPPPLPPRRRRGRFLVRAALAATGIFLVGALALQAADVVEAAYRRDAALGLAFAATLLVAAGCALAAAIGEAGAYLKLASVDRVRDELALAVAGEDAQRTRRLLLRLEGLIEPAPASALFAARAEAVHTAEALVRVFEEHVLRPLDERAYAVVGRGVRDVAVITAVAPTALLDTLLMTWRTLRLVREVAEVYGLRAGPAGTLLLLRRLARGAALVAATDLAATVVVQQIGGALAELVAARLGEGAVAASRTARVGLLAMASCRAVAFGPDDVPTIRRMVGQALGAPRPSGRG